MAGHKHTEKASKKTEKGSKKATKKESESKETSPFESNNLKTFIKRLNKSANEGNANIKADACEVVDTSIELVLRCVLQNATNLAKVGKVKILKLEFFINAIKSAGLHKACKGVPTDKDEIAEAKPILAAPRIKRRLLAYHDKGLLSYPRASILYLCLCLDNLITSLLKNASEFMEKDKKKTINASHVLSAVRDDRQFHGAFADIEENTEVLTLPEFDLDTSALRERMEKRQARSEKVGSKASKKHEEKGGKGKTKDSKKSDKGGKDKKSKK